jgi:hypothetical protein
VSASYLRESSVIAESLQLQVKACFTILDSLVLNLHNRDIQGDRLYKFCST